MARSDQFIAQTPGETASSGDTSNRHVFVLQQIVETISSTLELQTVLQQIVELVSEVTLSDACLLYLLDESSSRLILRVSKPTHPESIGQLTLHMGEGLTGWVAQHRQPVVIGRHAFADSRFKAFQQLPEDHFEAFLSMPITTRGRLVGVINVQHREPHQYVQETVSLVEMIGQLVGGAIERAQLAQEVISIREALETRKVVEQAKGILMEEQGLTEAQAFRWLQKQSMEKRRSMREIAEAIILARELRPNR